MVIALFTVVALAWATWLFASVYSSKQRLLVFTSSCLLAVVSSYALYVQLGATKELQKLSRLHESLKADDLRALLEKTSNKEISIEELFSEVRLRNLEDDTSENWMTFGRLLLQSEQQELAEQAFGRAVNFGDIMQQNKSKLEVAQTYIERKNYKEALSYIELVLLKNPKHEGALLLRGMAAMRLDDYQMAIDSWNYLVSLREPSSDSANLIQQQIDLAKKKQAEAALNYISIEIDNFANVPLHSFTKAFALIRPAAGGAPIAVKALDINELTPVITMTPSNLMLKDTDFWQVIDLYMEIRLSKSGFAKSETGDLYGRTSTFNGLKAAQTYKLAIDQSVN